MRPLKLSLLLALLILLAAAPYLYAAAQSDAGWTFGGFLLNPIDGNSYLAKMQQGAAGAWLFRLPYTPEPGHGVLLFTPYLLLGRLAAGLQIPLLVAFHVTRLLAAAFLFWQLLLFLRVALLEPRQANAAWIWAAIGSGLGWLAVASGDLTSDFWVAEAYPFLSAYANPHFPLSAGLMVWIFRQALQPSGRWRIARLAAAGITLALASPFSIVLCGGILAGLTVWDALEHRRLRLASVWVAPLVAAPLVLYEFFAAQGHPVLAGWNAQNLTAAPPVWDFLLSFSPALPLAVAGLAAAWKQRQQAGVRLLAVWLVLAVVLLYLPFNLQRRFLVGFYIPCVALALLGIDILIRKARPRRLVLIVVVLFALPTNLLILMGGFDAARRHSPEVYLSRDEQAGLDWITANTPPDALVLSSPAVGLLIPAHTGRQVVYGHPYETVPADANRALVEAYYASGGQDSAVLDLFEVDFVLFGPREAALATRPLPECASLYQNATVRICPAEGLR
jgi:hypothetical protein